MKTLDNKLLNSDCACSTQEVPQLSSHGDDVQRVLARLHEVQQLDHVHHQLVGSLVELLRPYKGLVVQEWRRMKATKESQTIKTLFSCSITSAKAATATDIFGAFINCQLLLH
jgi:hypothetical protein